MTSIIKFHALSGAHNESPPCYILQVDEFRFLLDCGWDEHFDLHIIKELKRWARHIDAVLLTYPDSLHLGALPYAVGKCGLSCPIYATIPVYKMGQMFMYDLYQSRHNMEDFELFTLDDVDSAFDKIVQLKYNQAVPLRGKGYGITIIPMPAGHMIGGTVWKIVKAGEEDIVYAVDFNHKKERHLNGCELEKINRPSLVITDTLNALYKPATRRARDENLMTSILQTLRNDGNVLIAVDTAGRVLELIHMLDQLWRNKESGLIAYSLAILNNVSYNVVEFAKSQIEWMSDKLVKSFEGARNNPFQFRHVQLCHSMAELNKVSSPKVVLASSPDMECGFSRDLFLQWADKPENTIIITNRTSPGTLARRLMDQEKTITLEVKKRVRLEGIELEEYQRNERETKLRLESESVELSSDSDDESMKVIKGKHDLLVRPLNKQQGFFKSSRKYFPMFPFHEEKVKYDDYGEFLKEDEFKMINILSDGDDKDMYDLKEEDIPDITEVPTKCINVTRTITVEANIQFIDFEGRSDGVSAEKIICNMKSRRVVLVRGSTESTVTAIDFIQRNGEPDVKLYSPKCGEVIDVTSESHIYQVRLTDALASSLVFKKGKDNTELAWLDARISANVRSNKIEPSSTDDDDTVATAADVSKKSTIPNVNDDDVIDITEDSAEMYTLEPLPDNEITGHEPTFINELKLFDFMKVLTKDNNIPADMLGGVLYCCNGTVAIRRVEGGKVILEGCVSEEYYKIRELLYQMYAII